MKSHLLLTMFAATAVTFAAAGTEARTAAPAPDGSTCSVPAASGAPAGADFQGCWTFFAAGPCRSVYLDDAGNYLLCGECGPSGEPNPKGCSAISVQTLNSGFWCS